MEKNENVQKNMNKKIETGSVIKQSMAWEHNANAWAHKKDTRWSYVINEGDSEAIVNWKKLRNEQAKATSYIIKLNG